MSRFIETIKCLDGELYNLQWHNLRLNKAIYEDYGVNSELLLEDTIEVPEDCKTGLFRCRVAYSETIETIEFIPHQYREIKSLMLVEDNNIDYHLKYANRESLSMLFEKRGDCDDILIVKNGFITDSYTANCIFYDGNKWYTPDTPLLTGTQRARLISEKQITPRSIPVEKIKHFEKIGLINAMWDMNNMPCIEIDKVFSK